MSAALFLITSPAGAPILWAEAEITQDGINAADTLRLNVTDTWDGATAKFGVMTCDGRPLTDAVVGRGIAGRVVDKRYIEARVGAGAWTPIGGHPLDPSAGFLDVTDPSPAAYVDIEMRISVPDACDLGSFSCTPYVFWVR